MTQFRLTQKYAKDCRINALSEPQPVAHPLDDWFIDVIRVNRKKIAMATHAQSTFTFFISYAEIGGATAVVEGIGILLAEFLYNQNLPEWTEETKRLFSELPRFCKTIDKKILGHMNEFKRHVDCYIHYPSNQTGSPIQWEGVTDNINSTLVNFAAAGQYVYPIEMLGKLIGQPLKAR